MSFLEALAVAGIFVTAAAAFVGWIFFSAYAWMRGSPWLARVFNFAGWVLIVAAVVYFISQTESGAG